jgi:hypothetical protein
MQEGAPVDVALRQGSMFGVRKHAGSSQARNISTGTSRIQESTVIFESYIENEKVLE